MKLRQSPQVADDAESSVPDSSGGFSPSSGGDLPQHSAQLVKVHRFRQVEIESGLLPSLDIIGSAKTGERYCFNRTFSLGLRDDIVAVTIWQSDIAQDCIELFRVNDAQ